MSNQPQYISRYRGADVEEAIAKALQLDSFAYQSTETVNNVELHILWKVKPSETTIVYGVAIHPQTGELLKVESNKGTKSFTKYLDQVTEETIKLETDLYTYTPIGKAQKATNGTINTTGSAISNTNRGKLGSAGDSLKEVFNAIFGTQQDQQPTITAANYSLAVSQSTVTAGGGEYGTVVAATTADITFTLSTSAGTAPYGYIYTNTAGTSVTSKTSSKFYYPINKQSNGDIKITLPAGKTATVIKGELKATAKSTGSSSENILYCNFDSKEVTIRITLDAGEVTTGDQTRYAAINASVLFGAAQIDNQLTEGQKITSFLTYLGNASTNQTVTGYLTRDAATKNSSAYTISKGYYYNYYAVTSSTEAPLSADTSGVASLQTSLEKDNLATTDNTYIWFIVKNAPTNKKIQQYAMNQWNNLTTTAATSTTAEITFKTATGKSLTYYAYRSDKMMAATGKYRIN
jgi:hypothetical protein